MVNALQDRPASSSPAPRRASRSGGTALRLGGAALVAVLAVAGADRAMDLVPSFGNPLEQEVVDHARPALQLALTDLSEYHAAQGTFEVVVDLEKDTPYLPDLVSGERTTYLARGSVDGLVDFRALGEDAVQVQGQSVTITLPQPRLAPPALDLEQSRVLARDRGLLERVGGAVSDSPTSEREVALLAETKLADAAAQSDLLQRSQDSTRSMLTGLARSLGYADVTVRFDGDGGV